MIKLLYNLSLATFAAGWVLYVTAERGSWLALNSGYPIGIGGILIGVSVGLGALKKDSQG